MRFVLGALNCTPTLRIGPAVGSPSPSFTKIVIGPVMFRGLSKTSCRGDSANGRIASKPPEILSLVFANSWTVLLAGPDRRIVLDKSPSKGPVTTIGLPDWPTGGITKLLVPIVEGTLPRGSTGNGMPGDNCTLLTSVCLPSSTSYNLM